MQSFEFRLHGAPYHLPAAEELLTCCEGESRGIPKTRLLLHRVPAFSSVDESYCARQTGRYSSRGSSPTALLRVHLFYSRAVTFPFQGASFEQIFVSFCQSARLAHSPPASWDPGSNSTQTQTCCNSFSLSNGGHFGTSRVDGDDNYGDFSRLMRHL